MESSATADLRESGSVIGSKYAVCRLLGSGGMGSVYEAQNTWTGRRVAVKILHPEHTRKREAVQRFMQEAKAATQIAHPNIVEVLDMGEDPVDGSLFIVQEFLEGEDLRQLLDVRGKLSPREALDIVVPVMGALVAAHRRGIVHRDIKPENLFLARSSGGDTVPKLIDFGVSKILADDSVDRSVTQTGTAVGTPNYMSPEQARGDADLDGRTDVWSMGVLLYEMLSGYIPFDAPNYNLLIVKIITGTPERIENVAPDLPQVLADTIHRALAPDRLERFATMRALLGALLDCPLGDDGPSLLALHRRSLAGFADATGSLAAVSLDGTSGGVPIASIPPPALVPSVRPPPLPPAAHVGALVPDPSPTSLAWSSPPPGMLTQIDTWTRVLFVLALVCIAATVGIWVGRAPRHPLVAGSPVASVPVSMRSVVPGSSLPHVQPPVPIPVLQVPADGTVPVPPGGPSSTVIGTGATVAVSPGRVAVSPGRVTGSTARVRPRGTVRAHPPPRSANGAIILSP